MIELWPWDKPDNTSDRIKAFARRDEITKRLSNLAGFKFTWVKTADPTKLQLDCPKSAPTTRFQKYMQQYTLKGQVIPMRLVAGEDQVCEDVFFTSAVDVGDLMAADDIGFQGVMMHLLEERNVNKDYATAMLKGSLTSAAYASSHKLARAKEALLFQDIFNDSTIAPPPQLTFCPDSGPYSIKYRSDEGWTIVELIEKPHAPVAALKVWVVTGTAKDGVTHKASDFVKTRAKSPRVKPL